MGVYFFYARVVGNALAKNNNEKWQNSCFFGGVAGFMFGDVSTFHIASNANNQQPTPKVQEFYF